MGKILISCNISTPLNTDLTSTYENQISPENIKNIDTDTDNINKIYTTENKIDKLLINFNLIKGSFVAINQKYNKMNLYCIIEIKDQIKLKTNISINEGMNPTWN